MTVSASPDFAQSVLATLADDLRSGKIDVGVAARELRRHGGKQYRALADWLEESPVNTLIASTLLGAVASLLVNQVPPIVDQDGEPAQQQPAPGTYTEDQVTEIIKKILDHCDETHDLAPKTKQGKGKPNR